jgi:hypothetical protein
MNTNPTTRMLAAAVALAAATWAAPSSAEDRTNLLDNRFTLSLGTFLVAIDTDIQLNGSAGQQGQVVDLEADGGLGDADRWRFDGLWRINDRHHIRALYFDVSRDASRTLDEPLVIGDTTYPVNVTLTTEFKAKILEVAYEYAFLRRDTYEVSGSIGAHLLDFSTKFTGDGTVNGRPIAGAQEQGDTSAPLPVLGLRGMWKFADNWYADAQGQWFGVEVDQIDGSLVDLRLGVTWMFMKNVGVGAGWNHFKVDVDASKKSFDGSLDWTYSGAQLFITGAF